MHRDAKVRGGSSRGESDHMSSTTTINRRVALQTLVVGLGAAGLGRAILACVEEAPPVSERQNNPPPRAEPTDGDEFVPGQSTPVNAGDEVPKVPKQEWEARVKQLEAEQARLFRAEVFSMVSPGAMIGKERSHVPNASVVDENGRKKVVVVVNHVMGSNGLDAGVTYDAAADADAAVQPMDASADAARDAEAGTPTPQPEAAPLPVHYITTVYLRATINGAETVVGLWEFASTDPAPPTVKFTLPEGVTSVTPYEWCTLHGLWIGSALTI